MTQARELRVGIFVLAGLGLLGASVFMIGSERRLIGRMVRYEARFDDVQGLRAGSSVQLGGLLIGNVNAVEYSDDLNDHSVHVIMNIVGDEAERIRNDSRVQITSKGLLGDKQVTITRGKGEVLPPGSILQSDPVQDMFDGAEQMMGSIRVAADRFGDEELHEELKGAVANLRSILHHINEGEGYPNRLLTSKAEADRISAVVANVESASANLALAMEDVRDAVERVKTGPGFVHSLIYEDGPGKPIAQVGNAADEIRISLEGIRNSKSFAHDLLFGGEGADKPVADIGGITTDLRAIVADVRAGKGTIGAFLTDPSVYEDVKRVLGNVERNKILRALVRYSIHQDEGRKPNPAIGEMDKGNSDSRAEPNKQVPIRQVGSAN